MNTITVIGLIFIIFGIFIIFHYLVVIPFRYKMRFRKERYQAEEILDQFDFNKRLKDKDFEERESAMLSSGISLSTFDKLIKLRIKGDLKNGETNTKIYGETIKARFGGGGIFRGGTRKSKQPITIREPKPRPIRRERYF